MVYMNMSYVRGKDGRHEYELRTLQGWYTWIWVTYAARMVYMNMSYVRGKDGIQEYELRTRQGW